MKKIGIDARLYAKTGVGVYIRNLLYYFQKDPPADIKFYVYLMQEEFELVQFASDIFIKRLAPYQWHSFAEQTNFLTALQQDDLDLMHFTYFSFPIWYKGKFVATVHDTILLDHKTGAASTKHPLLYELKHRVFKYVFAQQLKNAQEIITPSQTVKNNIVRLFGDRYVSKIFPIPEGVSYEMMQGTGKKPTGADSWGNFFMYIGNFYPHKNVERLVEAFAKIPGTEQLVLIGPDSYFAARIRQQISDLNQSERIRLLSNLSNEEVSYCYKHARALIHPSLAEGFGLPLIEAAYNNLPIIASDIDTYREILGNKYSAFNPVDIDDIRHRIEEFIQKPFAYSYEDTLKRFSFEAMIQSILSIYRDIA